MKSYIDNDLFDLSKLTFNVPLYYVCAKSNLYNIQTSESISVMVISASRTGVFLAGRFVVSSETILFGKKIPGA